jgi:hypothetical protein
MLRIISLIVVSLQVVYGVSSCLDPAQIVFLYVVPLFLILLGFWILRWFYKAWKEWKNNGFRFFD